MDIITAEHRKLFFLIVAAGERRKTVMIDLMARIIPTRPLLVIDGGNEFDPFALARAVRRQTASVEQALERVQITRVFTCYQMLSALREARPDRRPVIVLNLLATFEDESVEQADRQFLLQECLGRIQQLSLSAPVITSARPPDPRKPGLTRLFQELQDAAGNVLLLRDSAEPTNLPHQMPLL